MATERPTDDLQHGESDHETEQTIKLPTHFKFTVWWVDKDFNDHSSIVVAESSLSALSAIEQDENFNYAVRIEKGGTKI